jgi:hypothetical protein
MLLKINNRWSRISTIFACTRSRITTVGNRTVARQNLTADNADRTDFRWILRMYSRNRASAQLIENSTDNCCGLGNSIRDRCGINLQANRQQATAEKEQKQNQRQRLTADYTDLADLTDLR